MSGDVQPRKRKDKRRKRDDRKSDGDVTVLRQSSFQDDDESSHGVHITKMGNDDVHLHVHHEHDTGGNWCAKIIFFSLMAVLLGLVGLIILENRGLEDMDTPLSESRFSNYFNGLVDEHRGEHDVHDVHKPSGEALDEHDDHDDQDEEEEPLSEEIEEDDDHDHDDHEEEEPISEEIEEEDTEQEQEEDEEEVEQEEQEQEQEEDDDEEDNNAGENITAEDPEDDAEDEDNVEEATVEATTEATAEATTEYDVEEPEEDEPEDDAEDEVAESQEPASSTAKLDEEDEEDNDEADEEEIEEPVQSKAQRVPATTKYVKVDKYDEDKYDDDDFESLDEEPEDLVRRVRRPDLDESEEQKQDDDEEEPKEGSSWLASLAVKFGVGVALALVSRLVLIRKSPNTTEDEPPPPEAIMRRRLTIATDEDQIPDDLEEIPLLDDEYSEEEIEIEEEIEVEISDIEEEDAGDGDVALSASYVPETFEQMSSMYKSSPEPSDERKNKEPEETNEPIKPSGFSDLYVEYEDGAIEDYEHDGETDEEDEISDEEEDEISDVDDADLMSRLEAKYGRLPVKEYESDPDSDDPTWTQIKPKDPTTDAPASVPVPAADDSFQQELRQANAEMIRENYAQALRSFNTLIQYYADEPLAHLARAHFLERLAERERSNQRLLEAIDSYKRYLAFGELVASDGEFLSAGERCIEHLRFMGYHHQTVAIHELLIERLPADPRLRNQLSFTHLTANNMRQVKFVAAETLKLWPADPVAQLHFGLALKQLHGDYVQALSYLQNAIESKADGTQEAYFYLALGETLQRLSRQPEAVEVHRQGVARGFFVSVYQRSLYNEPKLRAQPFWQPSETGYNSQLRKLQHNWISIREEALALLSHRGYFEDETENLRHMGIWQQFELFAKGQLIRKNCQRAPITCSLLKEFPESSGCRRGQVKFSVMQAETHVWPHCGPTNCRLRAHLTLVAPEPERTSLRVAEQERTWREGELIIFDDSFEHEVWHNGTRPRLVLILDMWHPDLTVSQRRSLTAI
ncbi:aspartyl/asparaginyl beta-hydroxylase isoform X2 [Drosophila persimilis]|uniref:aspartyl/asparaginyl beta-hydroxylase isoform X2 n=1 Tax=Drosophila persimilis TaxID=7234 RepID=UPI000F08513C|nr:aspartyl/asparaginyl beta-hydroxylase isoform X2 [Drosophila persimilis]